MSKLVQGIKNILIWGLKVVKKATNGIIKVVEKVIVDEELNDINAKLSDCNDKIVEAMELEDDHKVNTLLNVEKYLVNKKNERKSNKIKMIIGIGAGAVMMAVVYIKYS